MNASRKIDLVEETLPDGTKRQKLRSWKEQFFECKDIDEELPKFNSKPLWVKPGPPEIK